MNFILLERFSSSIADLNELKKEILPASMEWCTIDLISLPARVEQSPYTTFWLTPITPSLAFSPQKMAVAVPAESGT